MIWGLLLLIIKPISPKVRNEISITFPACWMFSVSFYSLIFFHDPACSFLFWWTSTMPDSSYSTSTNSFTGGRWSLQRSGCFFKNLFIFWLSVFTNTYIWRYPISSALPLFVQQDDNFKLNWPLSRGPWDFTSIIIGYVKRMFNCKLRVGY